MAPLNSFVRTLKPYLSLEPAYFLFVLSSEISYLIFPNLCLQKKCRHHLNSTEPDLRIPCDDEKAGIEYVTYVSSRFLFTANIVGSILVVQLAAWSDKSSNNRKISILLPIAMKTVQFVGMCFQSYFWSWSIEYGALIEGIVSPAIAMRVAAMIYVCSVSSKEDRTFRIMLLSSLMIFCTIIGSGSSGFLLRHIGFFQTYSLCTVLSFVSLLLILFFLENPQDETQQKRSRCVQRFYEIFDLRSVFKAFKFIFKKHTGNNRIVVWLLSLMSILSWFSYLGETFVLYIYLRYRFGWNEQDYGIYYLYKHIGFVIGNCICLAISKTFNFNDYLLGIFTAFWSVLSAFGFIFASENFFLYLLPLLDIFRIFSMNLSNSLQSKFFESHETGRLFSVHETLNIAVAATHPAYNLLFKNTMNFAPSSIFVLSSAVNLSVCILYGVCFLLMRAQSRTFNRRHGTAREKSTEDTLLADKFSG